MELVDDAGEGPAGTSLMIRLCDVEDWSDAEYELTRLIAAEYKNLDYAIDRTNRPTATFYVGPANKMVSFSPPFLSLCASLDIEIWVSFNDAKVSDSSRGID